MADVERVVTSNDKQRFAIRKDLDTSKLQIRANQGHTLQVPVTIISNIVFSCDDEDDEDDDEDKDDDDEINYDDVNNKL